MCIIIIIIIICFIIIKFISQSSVCKYIGILVFVEEWVRIYK